LPQARRLTSIETMSRPGDTDWPPQLEQPRRTRAAFRAAGWMMLLALIFSLIVALLWSRRAREAAEDYKGKEGSQELPVPAERSPR